MSFLTHLLLWLTHHETVFANARPFELVPRKPQQCSAASVPETLGHVVRRAGAHRGSETCAQPPEASRGPRFHAFIFDLCFKATPSGMQGLLLAFGARGGHKVPGLEPGSPLLLKYCHRPWELSVPLRLPCWPLVLFFRVSGSPGEESYRLICKCALDCEGFLPRQFDCRGL